MELGIYMYRKIVKRNKKNTILLIIFILHFQGFKIIFKYLYYFSFQVQFNKSFSVLVMTDEFNMKFKEVC